MSSARVDEVRTSNQASTKSKVAAAVAAPSNQSEPLQAATATAVRSSARTTSNPDQAMSQCADRWADGSSRTSPTTHGTSSMAASPNNGTTHRAAGQLTDSVAPTISLTSQRVGAGADSQRGKKEPEDGLEPTAS
jgi:hypothetical protein